MLLVPFIVTIFSLPLSISLFPSLVKVVKRKKDRCSWFCIGIILCNRKEAHLARSFTIILCGITTYTLSFPSFDNSFFLSPFFFAESLSRSVFQTTNHNNNRRPTAQMIETDNDEKNRRRQHHHHHRSTTNTTTRLQQREETSTNTKLSNQQFKQAPLLSA